MRRFSLLLVVASAIALSRARAADDVTAPAAATQPAASSSADGPRSAPLDGSIAIAEKLVAATATVRISLAKPPATQQPAASDGVDVCSGISLGDGLVVTFHRTKAEDRLRVTWPGGEQNLAQAAVVDEFSALTLLEIDRKVAPGLELATTLPKIGASVLTGAAAGIEKPIVSLGILGGTDRTLPGSGLPPLLQCDVRTTEASSGAAVVDSQGRLIGVVAATSAADDSGGWTYAVPVSHVRRLLRARVAGQFTVLRRVRPALGLTMGPGADEGTVQVERVDPGGPAEKAGVLPGDLVLETDGRKVRSAYQAVDLVLKKQPGDEIELVIQHDGVAKSVTLTLDSAAPRQADSVARDQLFRIGPKLNVRALGRNQVEVQQGNRVVELAAEPPSAVPHSTVPAATSPASSGRDELTMLKTQLSGFAKVIERLQAELQDRDQRQQKTAEQLKALTEEVERLRKQQAEKGEK